MFVKPATVDDISKVVAKFLFLLGTLKEGKKLVHHRSLI